MSRTSTTLAGLVLLALPALARTQEPRLSAPGIAVDPEHPFLLVRRADLDALRERAQQQPWRELARDAILTVRDVSFDAKGSSFETATRMIELCGALALAQVVDPRPVRVERLVEVLDHWPDFYTAAAPPGEGLEVRWRQAAMTQSILALDVMRDDLSPVDRTRLEGMLNRMVLEWWERLDQDGTTSTPGVVALWALYRGNEGLFTAAAGEYLLRLSGNLTPGGVYASGTGYAWARQGGDRLAKYVLVDVLEHTGAAHGLYTSPRLRTLHEWMYRGGFTPRRTNLTFGDTDPVRTIEALKGYGQAYRAHRFSTTAGRNAAWVVRDVFPVPLLSTYVALDASIADPLPPTSAVWEDAATFWEAGADEHSLMGALWSPRASASHSHPDVNAVHLYAYGENVIRNAGYCGDGIGVDDVFDAGWIHDATAANSTVTIDGAEHVDRRGGGIHESLLAPGFDFAAAAAGPALADGEHLRALHMIHGEPGRPGYFVLVDEVRTEGPGTPVQLHLHPGSTRVTETTAGLRYDALVRDLGSEDVGVSLFLGTPPVTAELVPAGLCAFDDRAFVGTAMRATYASDAAGDLATVTLVVPSDATHPAPVPGRIAGGGRFSGASLAYGGGRSDFVVVSPGLEPIVLGTNAFRARTLHARFAAGEMQQYFARGARFLDDGAVARTGFDSDGEITLLARGTEVRGSSRGTRVTFHARGLTGAAITTDFGTVLSTGPGFVEIALAPGPFRLDLATGATLP